MSGVDDLPFANVYFLCLAIGVVKWLSPSDSIGGIVDGVAARKEKAFGGLIADGEQPFPKLFRSHTTHTYIRGKNITDGSCCTLTFRNAEIPQSYFPQIYFKIA